MVILKNQTIKSRNSVDSENSQGYSITYLPQFNSLLVYGVLSNSDVYTFSLTKKQWSLVRTTGKKPSFRRFYATYYHRQIKGLIIHGGQVIQKKPKSSDECYILFTDSWQWRKIFLNQSPVGRHFHSFFSKEQEHHHNQTKELMIFGGLSKPYDQYLNDLWCFRNLQNLSMKNSKHQVHGCQTKQIQTKGQPPGIFGYAVKVIDSKVLFFGGQTKKQVKNLQVNVLCLKTYSWQKLDIENRVCPSLMLLNVYGSAIDTQKLHIIGGLNMNTNKSNDKCFSLSLRQLMICEQPKSTLPTQIIHSCSITQSPLCLASVQLSPQNHQQLVVSIMYQKQPTSAVSKHFETDQLQDDHKAQGDKNNRQQQEEPSIQQYLKAIKHEQILSQQLIKKNMVLEQLQKQIQRYISVLYARYVSDPSMEIYEEIQQEKLKSIQACQSLKSDYLQNATQFESILQVIKTLRSQLGLIHQDFQRCIETQVDQEDN